MLGGLIAGALKGFAEGYGTVAKGELENQQKLDYQKEILRLTEEKDKRVAEWSANQDVEKAKRMVKEVDPLKIDNKVRETEAVGKVENSLAVDRERDVGKVRTTNEVERQGALLPGEVAREGAITGARGEAERKNLAAYGSDKAAREGVRAKARDQHVESSGAAASAESTRFELTQKRALADLRSQLAKTPVGSPEREKLQQQINDLSPGTSKSYSDVVTAGNAFRQMASDLRKQLEKDFDLSDAEKKDIRERIKQYEEQAASVLGNTVDKRLGGGASQSGATKSVVVKPDAPKKPWEKY